MAELKMSMDGKEWEGDSRCRLVVEGVTFRTNPAVVMYQTRYNSVSSRIKDLWNVVQSYRKESPVYLVFCLEDGYGIKDLLKIIGEVAPELYSCSLFITGTVLEYHRVFSHPEEIKDCYLEYSSEGRLVGAVGYYFFDGGMGA